MIPLRVDLSDGEQWAELRDPKTLTNGQRRPFTNAMRQSSLPAMATALKASGAEPTLDDFDLGEVMDSTEAAIIVLVGSWSFTREKEGGGTEPLPIPSVDPVSLDGIPAYDVDRLAWAVSDLIPALSWEPDPKAKKPSRRSVKR